ncbi:hypothetical protein SpCBS45565_g07207 [Spizellomyces sp. 'palustris']|nr:hypothetical protein SpCBS45565_g07207 [Spizellomyces sp. 'palustris']
MTQNEDSERTPHTLLMPHLRIDSTTGIRKAHGYALASTDVLLRIFAFCSWSDLLVCEQVSVSWCALIRGPVGQAQIWKRLLHVTFFSGTAPDLYYGNETWRDLVLSYGAWSRPWPDGPLAILTGVCKKNLPPISGSGAKAVTCVGAFHRQPVEDSHARFHILGLKVPPLFLCRRAFSHATSGTKTWQLDLTEPSRSVRDTPLTTLAPSLASPFFVLDDMRGQEYLVHPSNWDRKIRTAASTFASVCGRICVTRGMDTQLGPLDVWEMVGDIATPGEAVAASDTPSSPSGPPTYYLRKLFQIPSATPAAFNEKMLGYVTQDADGEDIFRLVRIADNCLIAESDEYALVHPEHRIQLPPDNGYHMTRTHLFVHSSENITVFDLTSLKQVATIEDPFGLEDEESFNDGDDEDNEDNEDDEEYESPSDPMLFPTMDGTLLFTPNIRRRRCQIIEPMHRQRLYFDIPDDSSHKDGFFVVAKIYDRDDHGKRTGAIASDYVAWKQYPRIHSSP